jgi:glycosyltransferase involved in cell wall biosynthesis
MSSLRVLYVNEAFSNFGPGPAIHGWSLVEEMQRRGAKVCIYPSAAVSNSDHSVGNTTPNPTSRLRLAARSLFGEEAANLASGLQRTVRRGVSAKVYCEKFGPDVVLARHIGYDWTPWIVARLLGRPLVLEVNAPMHLEKPLVGVRPPAVLRWMEHVQWRRATYIQTVSNELAEIVRSAGVPAERVVAIPNGADPLPRPASPSNRNEGQAVRIIFVGGFYPWHGVEHLLRAAALVRQRNWNVRLVLIGGGPQTSTVEQLARDLGIADIIEMHGRVSHEEVHQHLLDSDLAVAPYPLLRPFYFSPLKIFEYMAAGLPIIASRQGQMQEILEDRVTALLYPPGNIERLADSIIELAADAALRERIGSAALTELRARYTWGHTAEQVLELCAKAVGKHSVGLQSQSANVVSDAA